MELNDFIRQIVRRWYVIVLFLVAAYAGTWLYHFQTSEAKAVATAVVMQVYVAAPGEYIPPQVTLDAIDENSELAERVAARLDDGTPADDLKPKIDIGIRISSEPTLTPLYELAFSDPDERRALSVAGAMVEEALRLYDELNRPEEKDVRAAFAGEIAQLEAGVQSARAALTAFETENDAHNLTAERDQLRGYLNQLRLLDLGQNASGTGSLLAAAQAELNRLTAIEAEYTSLRTEADLAQIELFRLDGRVSDLSLQVPAGADVQPFLQQAEANLANAERRYATAQDDLAAFRRVHGVSDVTASRQAQLALVNQLTLGERSAAVGIGSVNEAIATAEAELARLDSLAPQYTELSLNRSKAEAQLSGLEQRILDVISGQTLPSQSQAFVFDQPRIQSNLLWMVITYGLATMLGGFAALTVIYLFAIFERRPLSDREIEGRLGAPVLAHVRDPRAEDRP